MAIGSGPRDEAALRAGVERWVRAHEPGCEAAVVEPLARPSAGLSSETLLATAVCADGSRRELVVRLPPAGEGLFPEYDLATQVAVQNALGDAGIPTAPAVYEPDARWLGAAFMVMPRVAGTVVTTNPSYVRAGWLVDGGADRQARALHSFLTTLARLHRLPPHAIGDAASGRVLPVAEQLDRWSGYLDWAAGDRPVPGYLDDARRWCGEHRPTSEPAPSILWGDVQLANCVFAHDGSVAALLDFELTGTGPAEMDVAWFEALHTMTVATSGGHDLPGFGDPTIRRLRYEAALGRPLEALHWYRVFALLRSGAIMVRIARLLHAQGIDDSWLGRQNPTEAAIAAELAAPA
ncbi:MAG: phosphotransferase family protein [Acidimicrobiia bacterium]